MIYRRVLSLVAAMAVAAVSSPARQTQEPAAPQRPADEATTGEALAERSGCLECHSVEENAIGPAYRDVAARYRDAPGARAALIEKVKRGGKGNWTDVSRGVPMPPHSALLSETDVERLVDWVLSLEREAAPES